ncbi:MAG: prolipoprotein diacylglyceryl transferase [Anaerolineae bacterium]|nr:prolipoprotein diacylglyceryl transferase [Anaerolineae bacterium]
MIILTDSGLRLFGVTLSWYGLIVCAAVFVAALLADLLARRRGFDSLHVWRALVPIIVLGLIGARLWYVFFPPQSVVVNGRTAEWLLRNFFDLNQGAVAVWTGGLGILGGLIGGGIGLYWYCAANKQPFAQWIDIAALCLPLGQAIGRLANGVNQELYGAPTDLPFGVLVSNEAQRVAPYTDLAQYPLGTTYFQPVFAYEAICCLLIFITLLLLFRRLSNLRAGDLALLYLVLYGGTRFLLEFMRANVSLVAGVNISQLVSLITALAAAFILFRHQQQQKTLTV